MKIFYEMTNMSSLAWEGLSKTAILAFVLAFCSLSLTIFGEEFGLSPYLRFVTYGLAETPAGLFLIATIGTIAIERLHKRK